MCCLCDERFKFLTCVCAEDLKLGFTEATDHIEVDHGIDLAGADT